MANLSALTKWDEGTLVSAATINELKTALDAIHAEMGDIIYNTPVAFNTGAGFYGWHLWRWLHYQGSSGIISDPTGIGDDVTMTDVTSGLGVIDLWGVPWIYLGKSYRVGGVDWCLESIDTP